MKAAQLRAELLKVLQKADGPITTTEARLEVSRGHGSEERPVVAEQVYRALVALQRYGAVRRVDDCSRRDALWELAVLFSEIPRTLHGPRRQPPGAAQ
ncbi:hypothetical protein AO501_26095 [Mycobacterium gordonae]|uniref:Fur family transcriptional regulator n=1 Tax=Mycobacterium gordonae TaxID=1778 RepID=A0A0Q2QM02_MYCGO|nr:MULTISPECIES: hypothetical protein [Mycobacterium]KQH80845.1 hypothetical protein AO501_26095 [Mycobacterium gordonae]MDP7707204.1 hypothetical protein [Mycobacterium sp. TY815]